MLCLTGNMYGHRGCTSDALVTKATIYAVADDIRGPYRMDPHDNVLLGSVLSQGYSCKTVLWEGCRTLFYTQGEYKAGSPHGCISRPHQVVTNEMGQLRLKWHPACDSLYEPVNLGGFEDISDGRWGSIGQWEKEGECVLGRCDGDWAILPTRATLKDGCIECTITLKDARSAGLCLRLGGKDCLLYTSSKEQLEKLRRDMQENEGLETTAIINIHRRLKLFFGEEAGISLAQNEHNGLQVTIFMPAKGDRHV